MTYILDIIRFALNDGPGIRTTVFLKGCPLRCLFCHNPESQSSEPETGTAQDGSPVRYGMEMSVEDVMAKVRADKAFYANSGGGLTVSGGEPMIHPDFLEKLLLSAKDEGIQTAVDTSGYFPASLLDRIVPLTDLWLFDYKETDPDRHKALTGVDNSLILHNLAELDRRGAKVILRCVLIGGINDSPGHLEGIVRTAARFSCIQEVDILPYHNTGNHKYARIGREAPLSLPLTTVQAKERWTRKLQQLGLRTFKMDGKLVTEAGLDLIR